MPVIQGDCREVMARMEENSIDSIVTDPPYALTTTARWKDDDKPSQNQSDVGKRFSKGFMGKEWDGRLPGIEVWQEALRVAKPGAHMLVFGGTRTHHRLMVAIEDAGWEIRDTLNYLYNNDESKRLFIDSLSVEQKELLLQACPGDGMMSWNYGSGFPKSLNIEKKLNLEQTTCLNIIKSIDNNKVLLQWKKILNDARSVDQKFQKNIIETGTCITKRDFVQENVILFHNQIKENLSAIIVELNLLEAHPLLEEREITVQENVGMNIILSQNHAKFVEKLLQSQYQYPFIITSIVRCVAKELQKEKVANNPVGEEALRIWLGRKKCLNDLDINVLCAGLTEGLKYTILNQSKTFQSLDTIHQTGCVCATNITITESIMDSLILYTVNILKEKTKIKFSKFSGWGTALKPAWEPIIVCRKPLDGTVANNILKWGVGGINIGGCRVGTGEDKQGGTHPNTGDALFGGGIKQRSNKDITIGRFPANIIHDGSEEVLEIFPKKAGACAKASGPKLGKLGTRGRFGTAKGENMPDPCFYGDSGSAARFFYCAKTSSSERNFGCESLDSKMPMFASDTRLHNNGDGSPRSVEPSMKNIHPTVKPLSLMRYLCRLVTPPGGIVLDPFAGSGSTGCAAVLEGFQPFLIEMESEYVEIAKARLKYWSNQKCSQ